MQHRITHIRTRRGGSSAEHITHVRVLNSDGVFIYPLQQVIRLMKSLHHSCHFYVQLGELKVYATHREDAHGMGYITTLPDQEHADKLLCLPRF